LWEKRGANSRYVCISSAPRFLSLGRGLPAEANHVSVDPCPKYLGHYTSSIVAYILHRMSLVNRFWAPRTLLFTGCGYISPRSKVMAMLVDEIPRIGARVA
jgi:hypothetical protein